MTSNWTAKNIPDLTGKVAIVTGANSGIGYETANYKGVLRRPVLIPSSLRGGGLTMRFKQTPKRSPYDSDGVVSQ